MFDNFFEISKLSTYQVNGLTKELNCIYIYNNYKNLNKNILVVASSTYEATYFYQSLQNYTSNVLFFPMDDFITSEAIAISPELKIERINTINKLCDNKKYIVVCNLMGLLRYLPKPEILKKSIINIKLNMIIDRDSLVNNLYNIGYNNVSIVSKTGEMAIRGYVIDIFPISSDYPIRIEFWGNNIESIKYFDIDSQLSNSSINEINIIPFSEFILEKYDDNISMNQKYLKKYGDVSSIVDFLGDFLCFYYDYNQILISYNHLLNEIIDYKKTSEETYETDYMNSLEDIKINNEVFLMNVDDVLSDENKKNIKVIKFISSNIENYNSSIEKIRFDLLKFIKNKKTVILCISSKNMAKKLLKEIDLDDIILTNSEIINNKINLVNKKISNGFIYNNYVVISETDLYNTALNFQKYKSKLKLGTKIKYLTNLNKGDYIVHEYYGIGIYDEIQTITKNGFKKDYIKLLYKDNDILYVPVEKIDKISKFTSKEGVLPKLNRLGSDDFKKTKLKLKGRLENLASELLKLYAEREAMIGFAFDKDDENQILFENEFQYKETDDQKIASERIKEEMEKNKPMDMLLCGDVGYGKTEVAFRAIFKAVNNSKQVAYLCPTTILSNQQYNNALNRFRSFPINIALLNRFIPKIKQIKILNDLKEGKIDILFGTHRILSSDIKYKDLGLLVVDEEQRFGVKHKEKLKEYKANVDVLTLSATPIPRTLQMSLAGLRTATLIETPPVDRYPIQTYVLPYNVGLIKDAIYKELSRNGQVYILHNRVENIELKVDEIKRLIPEAKIDFAHGKMTKNQLEDKMIDFVNHKFDVLVCTTIIETGIDIPNVNTLIVFESDKLGLSQLYQIRGRIGRSNKIGYAYLMYNNKKEINDLAVKRLSTIKEFTELGSGFKIAMRDLSIRGAGDILGSEQSGFIDAVGIDLYLKMLKDAVLKLKGEEVEDEETSFDSKSLVEVSTTISDNITDDKDLKIEIHKMINNIDSYESLNKVKDELINRFGQLDNEVIIYMYEEWFEKLAQKLNINNVNETRNYVEITLSKEISSKLDGEKLFMNAYNISKMFRFNFKNDQISIILDTVRLDKHFLIYMNGLLEKVIEMIK